MNDVLAATEIAGCYAERAPAPALCRWALGRTSVQGGGAVASAAPPPLLGARTCTHCQRPVAAHNRSGLCTHCQLWGGRCAGCATAIRLDKRWCRTCTPRPPRPARLAPTCAECGAPLSGAGKTGRCGDCNNRLSPAARRIPATVPTPASTGGVLPPLVADRLIRPRGPRPIGVGDGRHCGICRAVAPPLIAGCCAACFALVSAGAVPAELIRAFAAARPRCAQPGCPHPPLANESRCLVHFNAAQEAA